MTNSQTPAITAIVVKGVNRLSLADNSEVDDTKITFLFPCIVSFQGIVTYCSRVEEVATVQGKHKRARAFVITRDALRAPVGYLFLHCSHKM